APQQRPSSQLPAGQNLEVCCLPVGKLGHGKDRSEDNCRLRLAVGEDVRSAVLERGSNCLPGPDRIPDFVTLRRSFSLWRDGAARQPDLEMGRALRRWVHHRRTGGGIPLPWLWVEHSDQGHWILACCYCLIGGIWFQPSW